MSQLQGREIGQRIAQARAEQGGMTQTELADLLGVTMRSVQGYEAGDVIPYRHFQRLEEVFGRSLEWFLRGNDDEPAVQSLDEVREQLAAEVVRLRRLNDLAEARLAVPAAPRRGRKPA